MARYNISISSDMMNKVDKYKEFVKLTKSGFISKALENYFMEVEKRILEDKKKKSIEGIIKIREKIGSALKGWDSTAEIRKIRDTRWVKDKRWQDIEK
ncbi:MAG: hypothetical protein M1326_08020 [Cyanobacteria bacterium]|nr:hypothetical protein [Cyanobacteriota bacterium]